jgi:hypothetical protein
MQWSIDVFLVLRNEFTMCCSAFCQLKFFVLDFSIGQQTWFMVRELDEIVVEHFLVYGMRLHVFNSCLPRKRLNIVQALQSSLHQNRQVLPF